MTAADAVVTAAYIAADRKVLNRLAYTQRAT